MITGLRTVGALVVCLLLAPIGLHFYQTSAPQERVAGWQSDIDFLLSEMRRQHYVYRSQPLPEKLERGAAELKQAVPRFGDERMLAELQRLMTFLGDGHCYLLPVGARRVNSTWLPLRFYLFSDGLYVIDAEASYSRWIGSRVIKLGNVPAADAMTRITDFAARDNPMGVKWVGPFLLRFRGFLEAIGSEVGARSVRLELEGRDGRVATPEIELTTVSNIRGLPKLIPSQVPGAPPPPLYLSSVTANYWFKELPSGILYLQFNQVMDRTGETLSEFVRRLQTVFKERPPKTVIVDVRHNNGGHAEMLTPLVEVLRGFESVNPQSKLIVITGRNTFSAAQIFIAQIARYTKASFAGEPSSSKPNFVGEENQIVLPWSGALGSISNRYHESIPGDTRIWIEPDIKVELTSQDYFSNRDPVLELLLKRTSR
ncbi:MAG: hypothetical protein ACREEM_01040 [Blastocatellia bacterium]